MRFSKPQLGTPLNFASPLTRGLVAYFPLNEGAGSCAYDITPHRHKGVATGVTQGATSGWTGFQLGGRCFRFDGTDDYISYVRRPGTLLTNQPYSISAWVYNITPVASLTTFQRIVSWYDGSLNVQLGLGRDNASGTVKQFYIHAANGDAIPHAGTNAVSLGLNHVVAVYTGSSYSIYLNGTLSPGPTVALTASQLTNSTDVFIAQRGNAGGFFQGAVSDVGLWSRALNATEVQQLYAQPFSIYQPSSYFYRHVLQAVRFRKTLSLVGTRTGSRQSY